MHSFCRRCSRQRAHRCEGWATGCPHWRWGVALGFWRKTWREIVNAWEELFKLEQHRSHIVGQPTIYPFIIKSSISIWNTRMGLLKAWRLTKVEPAPNKTSSHQNKNWICTKLAATAVLKVAMSILRFTKVGSTTTKKITSWFYTNNSFVRVTISAASVNLGVTTILKGGGRLHLEPSITMVEVEARSYRDLHFNPIHDRRHRIDSLHIFSLFFDWWRDGSSPEKVGDCNKECVVGEMTSRAYSG